MWLLVAIAGCGWTTGPTVAPVARAPGRSTASTVRFDETDVRIGPLQLRTVSIGRVGAAGPWVGTLASKVSDERQEYRGRGATEWWETSGGRVEEGWDVARRPEGPGPLTICVDAGGTEVSARGGAIGFAGTGGDVTAHDLVATDAVGRVLPSHFEVAEGGFSVVVDDDGARYPVRVDPVYGMASATLVGEDGSVDFGGVVSGAGDVNGDGYDDVLVADYGFGSSAGRVSVYEGSPVGVSTTASTTLDGASASEKLGYSASSAGDVNGDGYADVVVGATYSADSRYGCAYLYLGSAGGPATSEDGSACGAAIHVEHPYYFGKAVSGLGDINGDGYDDVVVGATKEYYGHTGDGEILLGGSSGWSSPILGVTGTDDGFGTAFAGAGDVDGDGDDDFVAGAYGKSTTTGSVYMYAGSSAMSDTWLDASTTLSGETAGDAFGTAVAGARDVNNDGYDDVIVAAPAYNSAAGRAYVYVGSATGLSSTAATTMDGTGEGVASVAGLGDVDGDGYDDVAVGGDAGSSVVNVYLGSADGVGSAPTTAITGTDLRGLGLSVSAVGDVNGDGYADLIAGAVGVEEALVYEGYAGPTDADADGYPATTDCDDANAAINPGASEVCDGVDNNCDGVVDTDATDRVTYYVDADGDFYGDPAAPALLCPDTSPARDPYGGAPEGYSSVNTDCDDTTWAARPGVVELCDGLDNDCDGVVDDIDPSWASWGTPYYPDADGDGYGDPLYYYRDIPYYACTLPPGYSADYADCDDTNPAINPAATEICDGVDNNCDGLTDDADPTVAGTTAWYADLDSDGYGDPTVSTAACLAPDGYVANATDCDDSNASYHPGAPESCTDAHDYNCDGSVTYADADGDGWAACLDCDDTRAYVNPTAPEVCDGLDDNCDGAVDEGVTTTFYADNDGDGYGDPADFTEACSDADGRGPAGYIANSTDCDDSAPATFPGAPEVCGDGVDQDCDGSDLSCPGDTATNDTATNDTATNDTAPPDSGRLDSGTHDSAAVDTAQPDTARSDTGALDTAATDTGPSASPPGGCGCATAPEPGWPSIAGAIGLAWILRRRRR